MFLQILEQFAIFGHVLEAFDACMTVAMQIRVKSSTAKHQTEQLFSLKQNT
jgi:hypothetical protein